MNVAAAKLVAIGRVFTIVESTVADYRNGEPSAWHWYATFYDSQDIQKPLGYCGHNHRSESAAAKCCDKLLGKFAEQVLEEIEQGLRRKHK